MIQLSTCHQRTLQPWHLVEKAGKLLASNRTAEERSEAARKAVEARWEKTKKLVEDIGVRTDALLKKQKKRKAQP